MELKHCADCNSYVNPRRHIGAGTFFLVWISGFFWLLVIPFYQKKCPNCKGANFTDASYLDEIKKIANEHKTTLANQKLKSVRRDPYGNLVCDNWFNKEIPYFINNVLRPRINVPDMYLFSITNYINELADSHSATQNNTMFYDDSFSGVDYELSCLKVLKNNGWDATLTKGSGDQGVDIIAKKGGITAAIQCKKYSSTVGNKAVQEIVAGKNHYFADYAIVVTNSSFTESAYQLASTNKVLLLHHHDLSNLDNILN